MKRINYLFLLLIAGIMSCSEGYIDEISAVEAGTDEEAPIIDIDYPLEGTAIRVVEEETSITIDFSASDDIELQTIEVTLDGQQIATFNDFLDYRNVNINDLVYENLTNGSHLMTISVTDMSGKTTSETINFEKLEPYSPIDGEVFYLPFDGEFVNLVTLTTAGRVGSPTFSTEDVVEGIGAYKGAENSYLTFPTAGLTSSEFSASFWMKINNAPDRAGILVIGPPTEGAASEAQNNRTSGFRFFREAAGEDQRFKLNVGNGVADIWFDGGENADVSPAEFDSWHHFAFTISQSSATVYIDGEVVSTNTFGGISWNGCDVLSIMSGAPRFTEWGHLSDQSLMDELRIFDKILTQEEIQSLMEADQPQ